MRAENLREARERTLANRKLARSGGNPLQAKREAEAVLTFEEAARKVHALHLPTWRNVKHGAQFIKTLETYAFPVMGRLRVSDVTTADVLAVLSPIWTEKPETAAPNDLIVIGGGSDSVQGRAASRLWTFRVSMQP